MSRARDLANLGDGITTTDLPDITADKLDVGQIGGRRNLIINGAMQVAQRGNQTGVTNGYACDRFQVVEGSTTAVIDANQSTDSPDGFSNSLQLDVTTAQASIGAGEISYVSYNFEGQNLQHLGYGASSAQSITLSFWVKSSVTGTYAINLYQPDASPARGYTTTYTISASNTWEFKTITVAGDSSGTINNDNGKGLQLSWVTATGSDYTGDSSNDNSWGEYVGGTFANGHTANVFSSASNNFYLTGVQLEVGSVATPFEHRSYGEELALCQRYYELMNYGQMVWCGKTTNAVTYARLGVGYRTIKRATATLTITTFDAGNGFNLSNVATVNQNNVDRFDIYSRAVANSDDAYIYFTAIADAEL